MNSKLGKVLTASNFKATALGWVEIGMKKEEEKQNSSK